tara:strand:+ start:427 stop:972 length:546 start_codon:yes stop_codon:yes gene_type:complete
MASQRLTDKSALTGNLATDDLLMVVDASDTTGSAEGTSKKVTNEQILQTTKKSISASAFANMDATGNAGTFVELLPGAGTGNFYVILNVTINTNVTASTTGTESLFIGYDSTETSDFIIKHFRFGRNQSSQIYVFSPVPTITSGNDLATISSSSLKMYSDGNFSGNFSADAYITYRKCSIV